MDQKTTKLLCTALTGALSACVELQIEYAAAVATAEMALIREKITGDDVKHRIRDVILRASLHSPSVSDWKLALR
jgi:hypothetical protein